MKKFTSLFLMLVSVVSFSVAQTTWNSDKSHSNVQFTVTHMMVSEVTGMFKDFDATVTTKGEDFATANVNMTIKTGSIFTDSEKRDGHLVSDDFFNADKYPEMIFKSTSMKLVGKGKYALTGNLTIRDVTKPITLAVIYVGSINDPYGNKRAGFKVTGTVNRLEYGLKWNPIMEAGGAIVSDKVEINCNIQFIQQKDKE